MECVRKLSFVLIAVSILSVSLISGCGSTAQLSLKFSPNQSTVYKSSSETIKDFRFEQPNLDKLREEQTRNQIDMTFTQTIESVDADGVATAKITIDALKVVMISKNEEKYSFDSQDEKDKNAPLAKLIGQSYTITISPSGRVSPVDTKAAMASVKSSYEQKIVKSILAPKAITNRHEIAALPKEPAGQLSVKGTWSEMVPSPPGLLAPKTFEKTYTLTSVEDDVATVKMSAAESGDSAEESSSSGGMGFFAKMFDSKDDYTGSLKINTLTGQVLTYQEELISSYIAQEMPENGDPEKGPDTLTMRFTHRLQLEKVD